MRILSDQGTPVPLREAPPRHDVSTAYERGWSKLKNGGLLDAAEREGFEVFITTDSRLRYQQNLAARRTVVVCLFPTSWPRIKRIAHSIAEAIAAGSPGSYVGLPIP